MECSDGRDISWHLVTRDTLDTEYRTERERDTNHHDASSRLHGQQHQQEQDLSLTKLRRQEPQKWWVEYLGYLASVNSDNK